MFCFRNSHKNFQAVDFCVAETAPMMAAASDDANNTATNRSSPVKSSSRPQSACSIESEVTAYQLGFLNSSSRQPSFTSVRSECPNAQNSSRSSAPSKSHQLIRSSSSRSTFLSVPFSKIVNGLSSSLHSTDRQSEHQQNSQRRPSLQSSSHPSNASSISSLMASRFSLSK